MRLGPRTQSSPTSLSPSSVPLACRTIEASEWEMLKPLYDARAKTWTGHLDRTRAIWERVVTAPPEKVIRIYVVGDPIEGYAVLQHSYLDGRWYDVRIRDLVWQTPAAARRLAALLGDFRALVKSIEWTGCAADPIVSLLPEQTQEACGHERWMLRILDVARALETRGYPCISGEAHIRVTDRLLEKNEGDFVLRVENGKPQVTRGGRGDIALDVRALAAMYTGFAHPSSLPGMIEGDATPLATLFAGPEPWCADHY